MPDSQKNPAPISATGPAGEEFEVKVGASYLLSMLADAPARGMPGTTIEKISFQQGDDGYPMDDVVVATKNADGETGTLEIQAKRSITFAPKDSVFKKVMSQVAASVKDETFWNRDAQLAVATPQTSRQISGPYQEVLSWARQLDSESAFFERLKRKGTASDDMRSFVSTFREHLSTFGLAYADFDVWRLLRRFQILFFDFSKEGGAEQYWSIERAKGVLAENESERAGSLWSSIITIGLSKDAAGGSCSRMQLVDELRKIGFEFEVRRGARIALRNLADASRSAMDDISTSIGSVSLSRHSRLEAVHDALSKGRYLEIQGVSGVGKSSILKQYIMQLTDGHSILFLSPYRTVPGGWQALRHQLEFNGTAKDFLSELSASGAPFICIDNLDFFSEPEKTTVRDIIRAARDVPSIQVIATCRLRHEYSDPNWLPSDALDDLGHAPAVLVDQLNEQEVQELSAMGTKLAALLSENHPAKDVARNLFRLSRLALLTSSESRLRTEVDLAKLWWETGDGSDDSHRRDRQRILTSMAKHYLSSSKPFDSVNFSTQAIQQLVESETLLDNGGDRISFKHDVLKEWALACLFDTSPGEVEAIDFAAPGSPNLMRSYELYTQMELESGDKAGWLERIGTTAKNDVHNSWHRASLLAIVHSEMSDQLLTDLSSELLANEAQLARQLLVLAIASESTALKEMFRDHTDVLPGIPEGIIAPKNVTWMKLVVWLLRLDKIPIALIPAAADLMRHWLIGLVGWAPFAKNILTQFYDWLIEIETAKYPQSFSDRQDPFEGQLRSNEVDNLEGNLRLYFCLFADKAPDLAAKYLSELQDRHVPDHVVTAILQNNGSLAKASPEELSALTKSALIVDKSYRKRHRDDLDRGLSYIDSKFIPESPMQGPFYALLKHHPKIGLQLINELVNHVIEFQMEKWEHEEDIIVIPFDDGDRSFRYTNSFHWSRHSQLYSVTSALMALEAWGHKRIEGGDEPSQVIEDILELDNLSVALLTIFVDILLSSDQTKFEDILPFLACPELVAMDRLRLNIYGSDDLDIFDLGSLQQEPAGEVSTAFLKGKPSRRTNLEYVVPQFAFRAEEELRETLVTKLEIASQRLGQPEVGANFSDPALMTLYLRCQLDPENYEKKEIRSDDGEMTEFMQFKAPPELARFIEPLDTSLKETTQRVEESRLQMQAGSVAENSSKGSAEFAAEVVELARSKTDQDKDTQDLHALAAMLILRDGNSTLKDEYKDWATATLTEFGTRDGDYHQGAFSYLRYNRAALAIIGLSHALTSSLDRQLLRSILATVAKHPQAITPGLQSSVETITAVAPTIVKSILRTSIAGSVFPWKDWSDEEDYKTRKLRSETRITEVIDAEIDWILDHANEPDWPMLPPIKPKMRRGIRIGGISSRISTDTEVSDEILENQNPDKLIFDENSVARNILAILPTLRSDWVQEILDVFWPFTQIKNGVDLDEERADPPREWNECYFSLLATVVPNLSTSKAESLITERLIALPDDSFLKAVPPFLQQLDELTFQENTVSVENAIRHRESIAEKMMNTYNWKRLVGNTSGSMSIDFRPAISNLFFNTESTFLPPKSRLLELGIRKMDPMIPLLVKCINSAPSYAVAVFTMNLVEVTFMASHKPMVIALSTACLNAGITDREFWVETKTGERICAYFEAYLGKIDATDSVKELAAELDFILNQLIAIGVPEAQRLYDRFDR